MTTTPPPDRRKFFGLAVSLIAFGVACSPSQPAAVSPLLCVEFEFCITDAGTGRPIEGASVRLFNTRTPEGHETHTGPTGNFKFASECFTDNGTIIYPDSTFTTTAPGYQSVERVRMTDFTGTHGTDIYKRITVKLSTNPNNIAPAPHPVQRVGQ